MSQSSSTSFLGLENALRRANAEHVVVPFGVGICGHVAQTKEAVVLANAYDDPRFNPEVDAKTGYTTRWDIKEQLLLHSSWSMVLTTICNKSWPILVLTLKCISFLRSSGRGCLSLSSINVIHVPGTSSLMMEWRSVLVSQRNGAERERACGSCF